MPEIDSDLIRHALKTAREYGFRSVRLESGETKFRATLEAQAYADEPEEVAASFAAAVELGAKDAVVTSPCVGYFAPSPKCPKVGDAITKGQVIGAIMAVGLPNDVVCPFEGTVAEIIAQDGEALEYGQAVLTVERA